MSVDTIPWYPNPNPGGQTRRSVRTMLADWINAQRILGLDHVYRSKPVGDAGWQFDAYPHTGRGFGALVAPWLPTDSENRTAYTGAVDRGGKMFHTPAELHVRHRSYDPDSAQDSEGSEDDYDRIIDALKDCLRGPGRDLGHPDVILAVGEWPREANITSSHEEPVVDSESILRVGVITFYVTLYTTTYPGT
jgi:hypothetical protein